MQSSWDRLTSLRFLGRRGRRRGRRHVTPVRSCVSVVQWNEYCGRVLLGRGWSKTLDVAADIWVKHVGSTLVILLVYVDDLLAVGADVQVNKEVEGLCTDHDPEHVTMSIGRCGPASMFLGVARVVTRSGA